MNTEVNGWANGPTRGESLKRFAGFCKCHLDNRPRRNVNRVEIAEHIRGANES